MADNALHGAAFLQPHSYAPPAPPNPHSHPPFRPYPPNPLSKHMHAALSMQDTGGRGAVTQVSVKSSSSSSWTPMVNKWGAAWELGQSPSPPLDFKFQCDSGEDVSPAECAECALSLVWPESVGRGVDAGR